jgi:hypothetical protein
MFQSRNASKKHPEEPREASRFFGAFQSRNSFKKPPLGTPRCFEMDFLERFNTETLQKTTPRNPEKSRDHFLERFNPEALQNEEIREDSRWIFETFHSRNVSKNHPEEPREAWR